MKKIILSIIFTLSIFTISNAQYLNFLNSVNGSGNVDLKSIICRVGFGGSSCNANVNMGKTNANVSINVDRAAENTKKENDNLALWKTVGNFVGAIIQTAQGKKVEPIFTDEETDSIEKNVYLDGSGYEEDEYVDEETSDEYLNSGEYEGDSTESYSDNYNGSPGGKQNTGGLDGGIGNIFNSLNGGNTNSNSSSLGGGGSLVDNISSQLKGDVNTAPIDPNFKVPEDISADCKQNYGLIPRGSCPNVEQLASKVKVAAMKACTSIGKKIISNSQYRSPACNEAIRRRGGKAAAKSSHMSGLALDLNVNNLTGPERIKVFSVFKSYGFDNIGCYSKGSGDIHLDARAGHRRWGGSLHADSFNPNNCPNELIVVFGR